MNFPRIPSPPKPTELMPGESRRTARFFAVVSRVVLMMSAFSAAAGVFSYGAAAWRNSQNKARHDERVEMRLTAVEYIAKDCQEQLRHMDERFVPKAVLDEREKNVLAMSDRLKNVELMLRGVDEGVRALATQRR